jgi:maleylacetate reductase
MGEKMAYDSVTPRLPFVHESLPTRVVFGFGTRNSVLEEAARLNISRALILHGSPQAGVAGDLASRLGTRYAGSFAEAKMHTPVAVTEEALTIARELRIDGVIAIGGGSTTGLSKAIALRTDLPQIVVPTTYAGSEMTPILGETNDGLKTTLRSMKVLPETVIYDVDLTMDLPADLSGVSGMNAIAHSVEALYARDANSVISAFALESIGALTRSLPAIHVDTKDRTARSDALYGAWLAGICLGSVGMALHHKLCHTLGGTFNLPHAETHAIILPHALAYNASSIPDVMARLAETLGVADAANALYDLNEAIHAPRALSEIGMPEEGINQAVDLAFANQYWNPRKLDREGIHSLISRAYRGLRPISDR